MRNAVKFALAIVLLCAYALCGAEPAKEPPKEKMHVESVADGDTCIKCHVGIEPIRDAKSDMMQQILAMGQGLGDSGACSVCHGGNPDKGSFEDAHKGAPSAHPGGLSEFVRDPGSIWIADKTCGMCHADTLANARKSLMATEAGKIQGQIRRSRCKRRRRSNACMG